MGPGLFMTGTVLGTFGHSSVMLLTHGHASTIVTRQLPVDHWHEQIGDLTIADVILDRLIHNAHKINLKGGSLGDNMLLTGTIYRLDFKDSL